MFSSSVHQFVKSCGKDALQPVSNIYDADNAKMFQIVIKKRKSSWLFWRKNFKYRLSEFNLKDILKSNTAISAKVTTPEDFIKFNKTTKHSLSGEFGVDLKDELLDIDLKGSDSVAVQANFGWTEKIEADLSELLLDLSSREIDLDHELVKQVMQNKKKSLCVVIGVVYLKDGATLTAGLKADMGASIKANLLENNVLDGNVEIDNGKVIEIPKNKALAYCFRELLINTQTGNICVILDTDTAGGFTDKAEDEPDSSEILIGRGVEATKPDTAEGAFCIIPPESEEGLAGILLLDQEKKKRLKDIVISLLKCPNYISLLYKVFYLAADAINSKETKTISLEKYAEKYHVESIDRILLDYLDMAGFSVQDNSARSPSCDSENFKAFRNLVGALFELDDDELEYLSAISKDNQLLLIKLMHDSLDNRCRVFKQTDEDVNRILKDENSVGLLFSLGYSFLKESKQLEPPSNKTEMTAVWWICYCLTTLS